MTEHKHKWQHNNQGGITLMCWYKGDPFFDSRGVMIFKGFEGWRGYGDVFKAKRGDRWIARWLSKPPARWESGSAPTLREAMRLARAMVGINHGK